MKSLSKSIEDNEEANLALSKLDRTISKVKRTQKRFEILCDKLCEGLEKVESPKTTITLQSELKDFCKRISVGQEYRNLVSCLGLEHDFFKRIEDDYSEADECLEPIILELCKRQEKPSLDELVTACHTVNPDILKKLCKPLARPFREVLMKNYDLFYDKMHEIAVLPHLVSSGILTLKLQKIYLKTADQRPTSFKTY
ncbi:unnamed protein product [Mytilus coruscus]|uniref:Uncharacterized protein n=1 Tax=Mytilus coruscus TaxID=42192 RepID=A0A6J8CVR6_MYTCO|nr:unnamed protein product [Mytilus coruscus]